MIIRDEEQTLSRCLDCVTKFADEIIVVDTGSADKSVEIARRYPCRIYHFKWCDDFSAARNYSFAQATCDLIMWLDADDVVDAENCAKICTLKREECFDVAFLKYRCGSTVYYRERILRRSMNFLWRGAVHEVIMPRGKTMYSDAEIVHAKIKQNALLRNLQIYQKLIAGGTHLDARQKFYYGRELYFNGMYRESIAVLKDFLHGEGWLVNKKDACITVYRAYCALGEPDNAADALLGALKYAAPGSELCCELGNMFMRRDDYPAAVF